MSDRGTVLLALICSLSCVMAVIPENYILQVHHECGSDGVADAYATVVADLETKAKAMCAGGDVMFDSINMVTLLLPISYPGQGSSPCVFKQRPGSRVYAVTVLVSYGELDNPLHQRDEEYTLTCTFDPKGNAGNDPFNLGNSLIAHQEISNHAGSTVTDTTLTLTDILGRDFDDPISSGRVVQLKAEATGASSEVGVQPTSCDAIATTDSATKRYAILRAGCGDGLILAQDEGFTVDGLIARSPFFESFSVAGSTDLQFECNFTLCAANCDGTTCGTLSRRRRRRDAPLPELAPLSDGDHQGQARTIPVTVVQRDGFQFE